MIGQVLNGLRVAERIEYELLNRLAIQRADVIISIYKWIALQSNRQLFCVMTATDITTLTVTTPTTRLASPPRANHMASDTVD